MSIHDRAMTPQRTLGRAIIRVANSAASLRARSALLAARSIAPRAQEHR